MDLIANEKVIASTTTEVQLQFRNENRRTLRVTASLSRGGGPAPLSGVALRVLDQEARTPSLAALPTGSRVVIEPPEFVTTPDGQHARFAGWIGSTHKSSDWSRREPIPGHPTARRIEVNLVEDADIDLQYELPESDEDELDERETLRKGRFQ